MFSKNLKAAFVLATATTLASTAGACSKAPDKAGPAAGGTTSSGSGSTGAGKIAVPGAGLPSAGGGLPTLGNGGPLATAAPAGTDDSFKIDVATPTPATAGTQQVATVKATPGAGYKMNLPYPAYLTLKNVDGVTLAKLELEQEDASITEKEVSFQVKATPSKAGNYTLTGEFSFAVCDSDSCDPKTQPVTIAVTAN